ncbi:MAG: kinase-like domain-containing protein [Monoraphidium minutum]|nr:MAG: kinase-like domain-containing protein [Monoraphidium minutum]
MDPWVAAPAGEAVPSAAAAATDAPGATLKSLQVQGLLSKLRDSGVAKKAADLIGSAMSAGSSPRSSSPHSGAGGEAGARQPSPFGAGASAAAAAQSGSYSTDGSASTASLRCDSPLSFQGSVASVASQQPAAAAPAEAGAGAPGSPLGYSSLSAATKKTLGKLFGGSGSSDGAVAPAAGGGGSTNSSGLIAAFRSIIPKTSNASASPDGADARGSGAGQRQQQQAAAAAAPQPSAAPAPRSTLLAVCPHLPPSMQRAEWSLADFEVLEKLYTGYASVVHKGICKRSREVVVLKSYTLSAICELYQHQIYREVRLHSSLQHENVVKLYAAFKEGDRVVMVQEYADGGDLFSLLQKYGGRLGEKVAVQMVLDPFTRVLQYLHTRSIVHRDIKPENILFTKGSMCLKLADFGLAIDLREERAVTRAGTLDYMAPEILRCPYKSKPEENKEKEHLHYGNTVDSWAVGVLTYELLVGCPPFYDQSRSNTEARIKSGVPVMPSALSEGARNFIAEALVKDPLKRPTCLDMVHHPWIEMLRARRSMRVLATQPAHPDAAAAVPAPAAAPAAAAAPAPASARALGEAAPRAPKAPLAHAATQRHIAAAAEVDLGQLRRVEAMLVDGPEDGSCRSAASSPCLGAHISSVGQIGAVAALGRGAGLGQLSRLAGGESAAAPMEM